jgi:hypothetical protein
VAAALSTTDPDSATCLEARQLSPCFLEEVDEAPPSLGRISDKDLQELLISCDQELGNERMKLV